MERKTTPSRLRGQGELILTLVKSFYKVANNILELPGDDTGSVKEYNGGYSDYMAVRIVEERGSIEVKQKEIKKDTEIREKPKKLKFSYKEEKEYETIDEYITNLEAKITDFEKQLEKYATDYVKLQELMDEKQRLEDQLDEKMSRWVYLNDLAEKIENQRN